MVGPIIPIPSEHAEQVAVIQWWDAYGALRWPGLQLPNGRRPLFSIPNGGDRDVRVARKLQSEGTSPGVPDLCLPVSRGDCPVLWIEMKRRRGGRVSPDQAAWHEFLQSMGHRVMVARGSDEAIAAIMEYLG